MQAVGSEKSFIFFEKDTGNFVKATMNQELVSQLVISAIIFIHTGKVLYAFYTLW